MLELKQHTRETKLSFDLINDTVLAKAAIKASKLPDEQFYCFTFKDDDYNRQLFTFESANFLPRYIAMTAPEDKETLTKAQEMIITLNSHLKLEYDMMGYSADDFLYNRITVRYKVMP